MPKDKTPVLIAPVFIPFSYGTKAKSSSLEIQTSELYKECFRVGTFGKEPPLLLRHTRWFQIEMEALPTYVFP